jgi:oligoribonuclease NrnB/cAMP/cGMP phosphodiesterase (DHH superfamily)
MDVVIYHNKDLDGVGSAAIAKMVWPDCELLGFDYGDDLDLRRFKTKKVLMVDVSLSVERMISLSKVASEFIFVDHHFSFFEDIMTSTDVNDRNHTQINSYIDQFLIGKINYYYSKQLAGCEMMLILFGNDDFKESTKQSIRLLGQYDTWRNTYEKQIGNDLNWDLEVMPFQWGMRGSMNLERIVKIFKDLDDWKENLSIVDIVKKGFYILSYQKDVDAVNFAKFGFEFEWLDQTDSGNKSKRVIALNGGPFNSQTFRSVWNPEYHDIMMPFIYNGKTNTWSFSLYTTKDDIDILSIAKSFGGGGHKQACGFQVTDNEVSFKDGNIIFKKK